MSNCFSLFYNFPFLIRVFAFALLAVFVCAVAAASVFVFVLGFFFSGEHFLHCLHTFCSIYLLCKEASKRYFRYVRPVQAN